jgi:hypothetical protein
MRTTFDIVINTSIYYFKVQKLNLNLSEGDARSNVINSQGILYTNGKNWTTVGPVKS